MSGMAHETMPMVADTKSHAESAMDSHEKPAAPKSTWLGLLANDVSSKAPLAADGMSPERPGPAYDKLRAWQPTAIDSSKPVREIRLTLDGDMDRYVWFLNNYAAKSATVRDDEIVAINARLLRLKKGQAAEKREQKVSAKAEQRGDWDQKTVTPLAEKSTCPSIINIAIQQAQRSGPPTPKPWRQTASRFPSWLSIAARRACDSRSSRRANRFHRF
jgi:hypothetical protein